MKQMVKVATLLSLSAATLLASGWRIPEQSLNATALSAAYVASASGADASYYNPANMAFMADGASLETALTYINLSKIKYTDSAANPNPFGTDADSKIENFYMPTFHYVSPKQGSFRYGLSIVAPGGLSKRWDESYAKTFAEEFSLKIIEVNPTVSYQINDQFALGFGLRAIYTDGIVKSSGIFPTTAAAPVVTSANLTRDLTGDSIDFGYNLAASYKANEDLTFSATYRSKVDLTVKGDAEISGVVTSGTAPLGTVLEAYNGSASVTIPLPASLALAVAYDFDKTKVEFVFERTFWSAYKDLDFDYSRALNPIVGAVFDDPKTKNWKDANAYRIGITHQYSDTLKFMLGFAIDEAGANKEYAGFELPDSDAKLYSFGIEYKLNSNTTLGLAYLYDKKESLTTTNVGSYGTFEDASAHLVTASLKYKF